MQDESLNVESTSIAFSNQRNTADPEHGSRLSVHDSSCYAMLGARTKFAC